MNIDIQEIRDRLTVELGSSPPAMFLVPIEQVRHIQKNRNDRCRIKVCLISGDCVFEPIFVAPESVVKPAICLQFGNKGIHFPDNDEWEVMQHVFNILLRFTPERQVHYDVGMNESGNEYMLGNIRIRSDRVCEVENALIRQPIGYDLSGPPDLCLKLLTGCFKRKIEGVICFLTLLLSFTLSSLERITEVRPSFVLLLIGQSGSFKTSFAQAAFGFYGGAAVSSFRDSVRAIVETLKNADDVVCVLDDFNDYTNSNQNEKLEEVTRLQGDRTSVRKVMIGGRVDNRSVNSLSVVTGENFPKAQPSSIARMAILDVNGSIDSEGLSKLQESQPQYIGSLIKFIQFLVGNKAVIERLRDSFKSYRSDLTRANSTPDWHPRYTGMYSWLTAGWDMWSDYCSMQGVGLDEYGDVKAQLFDFVMEQHRKYLKTDVIAVFFETVGYLVSQGKLSTVDISNLDGRELKPKYDVIYDDKEIHYDSQRVFSAVANTVFEMA